MKSKSSLKLLFANAGLAGALAVSAAVASAAQALPKEGKFAYRSCWSGASKIIALSKSHVAFSYDLTGENVADTPGSLFDHASFRCVGVGARFGKESSHDDVCLFVDPDGDKDMARITTLNGKQHREDVAGTGKYDGMTIQTDLQSLGAFPTIEPGTFQGCNHVEGTYQLK
jgi:hypothetical protein